MTLPNVNIKFIANQLYKEIDPTVREVWRIRFIPIEEVVLEIQVRDAMEEKASQIAQKMLADGLSPEIIGKYTGLDKEDILALS